MAVTINNLPLVYLDNQKNKVETDEKQRWEREFRKSLSFISQDYVAHFLNLYHIAKSRSQPFPDWDFNKMTIPEIFEKEFNNMFEQYTVERYTGLQEQDITFRKEIIPFKIEVRGKYKTTASPVELEVILNTEWKEVSLVPSIKFVRDSKEVDIACLINMLNLSTLGVKMNILSDGLAKNFNWNYKNTKNGFQGDAVFEHRRYLGETFTKYDIPTKIDVVKEGEKIKFTAKFKGLTWS
ncbi:hypothetical protein HZA97_00695 [Candidatus Woesearchaeota archaeon]|nr:hypothetical protein [Candidatus Woesearchaeota archaeon]